MRIWKPTLQSIYGLLGAAPPSSKALEDSIEAIQGSMLDALGPTGPRSFPSLTRRIQFAQDLQALWYLRGDLMAALASLRGEAHARTKIKEVSAQFEGLLPRGLSTRPSPLGD